MRKTQKHITAACSSIITAACVAALFPTIAMADSTLTTIPDYSVGKGSRGTFVQGTCASADGESVYVFKQNTARWPNLQRISLSSGKSTQVTLDSPSSEAIGHGNGMACTTVNGVEYLLVAPGSLDTAAKKSAHYLLVMRADGDQAHFVGKVNVPSSIIASVRSVAVTQVNGNVVNVLITAGKTMRSASFDMQALTGEKDEESQDQGEETTPEPDEGGDNPEDDGDDKDSGGDGGSDDQGDIVGPATVTATKIASISGYTAGNQGISVYTKGSTTWVFASYGGWTSPKSTVIAYTLKNNSLTKQCVRFVDGECETAFAAGGKLYLSVEGKTSYNQAYQCAADDKLIKCSLPNLNSITSNGWKSSGSKLSYATSLSISSKTVDNSALITATGKKRSYKTCITSVTLAKSCKKISKSAFSGFIKLKKVTTKNTKLTKTSVKGCFKGSKVTSITVKYKASKKKRKLLKKKYKKVFSKKNCGKKITITVKR